MIERLKQDAEHYAEIAGIPVSSLINPVPSILVNEMKLMVDKIKMIKKKKILDRFKLVVSNTETFEVFASRVGCLNRNGIDARLCTVRELALKEESLECELLAMNTCSQAGLSERDYGLFLAVLEQAQKEGRHLLIRVGSFPKDAELKKRLGELL